MKRDVGTLFGPEAVDEVDDPLAGPGLASEGKLILARKPWTRERAVKAKADIEMRAFVSCPWTLSPAKLAYCVEKAIPKKLEAASRAYAERKYGTVSLVEALRHDDAEKLLSTGVLGLEDSIWGRRALKWKGLVNPLPRGMAYGCNYSRDDSKRAHAALLIDSGKMSLAQRVAAMAMIEVWAPQYSYYSSGIEAMDLVAWAQKGGQCAEGVLEASMLAGIDMWAKIAAVERNRGAPIGSSLGQARKLLDKHGSARVRERFDQAMAPFAKKKLEQKEPSHGEIKKQQAWLQAVKGVLTLDEKSVLGALKKAAMEDKVDLFAPDVKLKSGNILRSVLGLACEMGAARCVAWLCEQRAPTGAVVADGEFLSVSNPFLSMALKCLEESAKGAFTPVAQKEWETAFIGVKNRMRDESASLGVGEEALAGMIAKIQKIPDRLVARFTDFQGEMPAATMAKITYMHNDPRSPVFKLRMAQSSAILEKALLKSEVDNAPEDGASSRAKLRL